MQEQQQRRAPKVSPSKNQQLVRGPSGHYYIKDEAGRIIDPDTGLVYDPMAGLLYDPTTGLSIDLMSGNVYDLEGNVIGKVPLSSVYGITPNVSTTVPVARISPKIKPAPEETQAQITPASSGNYKTIKGPTGKYYFQDEAGRIIDPDTGIIFDPLTNILTHPDTGISIDVTTGNVYDKTGNFIGTIPVSSIYKMMPNVSTVEPFEEIKPTIKKVGKKVVSAVRKVGGAVVKAMDALAEGYAYKEASNGLSKDAEDLLKRLQIAYSKLDEEIEFMKDVVAKAIEYVSKYNVGVIYPKPFIEKMYGDVDEETERKIVNVLKFLWSMKIVPPRAED